MASFTATNIKDGCDRGVLPMLETPSGGMVNQQGNDDGHAYAHATGARRVAGVNGVITPSATTVHDPPLRVIYATAAGVATVVLADDTTATFPIPLEANVETTKYEIRMVTALTGGGTLYGAS